jgi:hypothetical protein
MLRQRRLIRLPLVGTILLCVLAVVYMVARKRGSKRGPSPVAITEHTVNTPSDDVLKYWTVEKMRDATAVDLPHVDVPDPGKQHPQRSPHASSSHDA